MTRLYASSPGRLLALCIVLALSGCAQRLTVKGKVTLNAQPVTEGSIHFAAVDGKTPGAGTSIKDGSYELVSEKIQPGPHIVSLRVGLKTGKQIDAGPPAPAGTKIDEMILYPSPRSPNDHKENRDLTAGTNVLDFDLKTP